MIQPLPEKLLSSCSDSIARHLGLHFPKERWRDLERGMASATREFGFTDTAACMEWLLSAPELTRNQIETLAGELTIGETYFFREQLGFDILQQEILPELICRRGRTEKRLRIWSAACSTGEEPYSLAIALRRMIPDLHEWNVTLLATDINPRFLRKAADGLYGDWSFRENPEWVKDLFFRKTVCGRRQINAELKEMVTFGYLNLAADVYPSLLNNTNAMDIIFCRNVLMYFSPDHQKLAVKNLYRCLVEGGWLFVSPSETSQGLFAQFQAVNFPGGTFYRKPALGGSGLAESPLVPKAFSIEIDLPERPTLPAFLGSPPASISHLPPGAVSNPEPQRAASAASDLPPAYERLLAWYDEGNYSAMEDAALSLLSQKEGDAKTMALLARTCANMGKLAEARAWAEKAAASDKLNAGLCYLWAVVLQESKDYPAAVAVLNRALYVDPKFVLGHFALGHIALEQKLKRRARKHFENALALLRLHEDDAVLPESEGMTAGRLRTAIEATDYSRTIT